MQNKVKAILIVIGISPFPEISYRLCLRKRFHGRVLPAFYVRDCRGKPTAPARTCNGKPDRLRERPKNIRITYHGLALPSIFTRYPLLLFILKSDGLGKEQTDYKLRSMFDQFAACLYESFASCQEIID